MLEEFEAIELFRKPLVIVASADNPLADKRRVSFEDLRRCSLVAFEVNQTCFDILATPFTAAGFDPRDIDSAIIDFLDFARRLGTLPNYEIMPIEEGLCDVHGLAVDEQSGAVCLNVRDKRLTVTYYALFRKEDERPAIRQTKELVRAVVEERRCTPDLLASGGALLARVFAQPLLTSWQVGDEKMLMLA